MDAWPRHGARRQPDLSHEGDKRHQSHHFHARDRRAEWKLLKIEAQPRYKEGVKSSPLGR
jgi:hypothetical protein